jgi:hypothetical protein
VAVVITAVLGPGAGSSEAANTSWTFVGRYATGSTTCTLTINHAVFSVGGPEQWGASGGCDTGLLRVDLYSALWDPTGEVQRYTNTLNYTCVWTAPPTNCNTYSVSGSASLGATAFAVKTTILLQDFRGAGANTVEAWTPPVYSGGTAPTSVPTCVDDPTGAIFCTFYDEALGLTG